MQYLKSMTSIHAGTVMKLTKNSILFPYVIAAYPRLLYFFLWAKDYLRAKNRKFIYISLL